MDEVQCGMVWLAVSNIKDFHNKPFDAPHLEPHISLAISTSISHQISDPRCGFMQISSVSIRCLCIVISPNEYSQMLTNAN